MIDIKKRNKRLIKKSGERSISRFTIWFSLAFAGFFSVIYILNASKEEVNSIFLGTTLALAIVYYLTSIYCIVLKKRVESDIECFGHISGKTRKLSLLLFICGAFGNIFAVITALNFIKEEKSLEYKLSYFTALITSFLLLISVLNLFKESPSSIQHMGVVLLAIISITQWICVFLVGKYSTIKTLNPRLKYIGYIFIVLTISGNVLSLITGIVIIVKVRNVGSSRNIMWIDILRRLFRNPTAVAGLFYIVFLIAVSIYSFFIFDYSLAVENDYSHLFEKPSLAYPFGTDEFGRDVFVRIIFGARISLAVGFVATMIPIIFGGCFGAIAGYYGKDVDNIIMRLLDVLYAIPGILLAIAIVASFGANTFNLIMALSIGGIPGYARTVRAQVMQLADAEFIEAARACGTSNIRIIFEDIIPNSLSPVIVRATLSIGFAVLSTSALSFLGLGVQPPTPEWGNVLKAGSEYLEFYPHLAIFPGLAIVSVVLSFNFFGDGLRDALDPKLK
ncbi:ABC transporter permease [Wukongibacter baidiensis]|uniref:ABC transporter permease n=1 Tax=Wukongibacter baidiensis TaxID=1723361 RepID=UPI003D7FCC09